MTKETVKRMISISNILLLIVSLVLSTVGVYAWLSANRQAEGNGMDMSLEDVGNFYLGSKGIHLNAEHTNPNLLAFMQSLFSFGNDTMDVTLNGTNTTFTATIFKGGETEWLVDADNHLNNYEQSSKGIEPGSKGQMTFYLIPKTNGDLSVSLSLSMTKYKKNYEESTNETANLLFDGRLNFFRGYNAETGVYSNWIEDGTFDIEIENAQANVAYPFTIYWIWPTIVAQLIYHEGDPLLYGYSSILDDATENVFLSHLQTDTDKYFYFNNNFFETPTELEAAKAEFDAALARFSALTDISALTAKDLSTVSAAYNNGDQYIGEEIMYFTLTLSAHDAS